MSKHRGTALPPELPPELPPDEQRDLAIEWFYAMWAEALKRGVGTDTLATVALPAAFGELIRLYGEDGVATLAETIPDQIRSGVFTAKQ